MLNNYFKKMVYRRALREIAKLQQLLCSSYFVQENNDKQVHQQRIRVLSTIRKNKCHVDELNHIADIIFSLNQLRHRIKDFSIFEVCSRELNDIASTSVAFIQDAVKFSAIFSEKIHQFETLYHNTLRVVAPDPLVFLFFIQDLYALHEKVNQLRP
jgi:hypothetical protein